MTGTANGTNGHHAATATAPGKLRSLKPGIYAPIPTFFKPDSEDLDLEPFKSHILRLAHAGVHPLLAGSMGEAHHLSHSERTLLIRTARSTLDGASFQDIPIIAGTGAGSTRETIELCVEAREAGADAVIVICSGYFAGAFGGEAGREALKAYWRDVAGGSEVPVIIYNYPGAAGGIDLDSTLITELAQECPNIIGVKLTCGNVGKLTRICATVTSPSFASAYPRKNPDDRFLVLGGFADFLLPSAYVGAHGAITGLANVAPHTLSHLFNLSNPTPSPSSTQLSSAQHLQGIVARADFTIAKTGISGTKALLERLYGYGGVPRRPLPPMKGEDVERLWEHGDVRELVGVEREVSGKRGKGKAEEP